MGTLYLVRHGQASFGADDYDQLSPLGRQQAVRLGEYLRPKLQGQAIEAVMMGSLKRHRQTWEGIAEGAGLPFELGIIRNHYVGRTFIEPTDQIRHLGVKLKHNANRAKLRGKRVILVDDSIVRGTTSKKIVEMVRQAGASEVHMRISSPPIKHPDFYGIDTPEQKSLLAATHTLEEMRQYIGVDSLAFVSVDGVYRAVGYPGRDNARPQFTDHCFTGDYPTHLTDLVGETKKQQLSLLAEAG